MFCVPNTTSVKRMSSLESLQICTLFAYQLECNDIDVMN